MVDARGILIKMLFKFCKNQSNILPVKSICAINCMLCTDLQIIYLAEILKFNVQDVIVVEHNDNANTQMELFNS